MCDWSSDVCSSDLSRGETKYSALLSSRDTDLLEPNEWPKGSQASCVYRTRLLMQDMRAQSLGQEDPLEKEMAPHFSTLAWKIPWMEEPGSDTLESTQWAPRDPCRDLRGEQSTLFPLEMRPYLW